MDSTNWKPISTVKYIFFAISFLIFILILATDDDHFIRIMDDANLVFHEAGHVIFGIFGDVVSLYGGTLGELVFPLIAAIAFWRQRLLISCSVSLLWLFENFIYIATYMGDARAHELPLIGGIDPEVAHDWTNILNRWGMLEYDTILSTGLKIIAWVGFFATFLWVTYHFVSTKSCRGK